MEKTKAESKENLDNFTGAESAQASKSSENKEIFDENQTGDWILVQRKKKTRNKMVQRKKKTRNKFQTKHQGHGIVCPIDRPK